MIGFSNLTQLREMFLAGGMGFLLGAYYDVFRIIRRILRVGIVRVLIQDLVFFVTAAFAVFLFALAVTGGVIRLYLYIGLIAGFFAYRYTVGQAVVGLMVRVVGCLSRLEQAVGQGVQTMCRSIGCAAVGVAKTVCRFFKKNVKKMKKGIATEQESVV